jgi:anti-anti-sigma regulatory factor
MATWSLSNPACNNDHRQVLREKMIHETEFFLNGMTKGGDKWRTRQPAARDRLARRAGNIEDLCDNLKPSVSVSKAQMSVAVVEAPCDRWGCFDGLSLSRLSQVLLDLAKHGRSGHVVVELSDAQSLNAAFLNVLTAARSRLARHGRVLALCGLTPSCLNFLALSGIAVPCFRDVTHALASFFPAVSP